MIQFDIGDGTKLMKISPIKISCLEGVLKNVTISESDKSILSSFSHMLEGGSIDGNIKQSL